MSVQVRGRLAVGQTAIKKSSFPVGLDIRELVVGGLTALLVIGAIFYYVWSLRPVQARLSEARSRDAAQNKVISGNKDQTESVKGSTKDQITLAKASLDDFEEHYLKPVSTGRIEVIDAINELVAADKLHLTSGIDMRLLKKGQITEDEANKSDSSPSSSSQQKKGDALDVFPKTEFRFSVAGSYDELRKFLKDLQESKEFWVIDSVVFGTAEGKATRAGRAAQAAGGIQLNTTLTAYFRPQ